MDDAPTTLRFDEFELDLAQRRLLRGGREVELGSRYFDALALLAGNAGSLVTKDRFMAEVWRGIPVTDEALTQCIRTLRRALDDDAARPRFIATVPKHGYRFVASSQCQRVAAPAPPSRLSDGGRLASAATLGGGGAGLLAGLFYGLAATDGGSSTVFVLVALVGALGVLAGAGVGAGMGLASGGSGDWRRLAAGGLLGGMLVGGLGQILGRDGIAALTGARLGPVTGLFEGALLGAAAGFAACIALRGSPLRHVAAWGTLFGALAGAMIALAGGRLLGASLLRVQERFAASQLDLARVGLGGAEAGGHVTVPITALEGGVFVACIACAIALSRRT